MSASMRSSASSWRSAIGRPRSIRARPSSTRSWLNRMRARPQMRRRQVALVRGALRFLDRPVRAALRRPPIRRTMISAAPSAAIARNRPGTSPISRRRSIASRKNASARSGLDRVRRGPAGALEDRRAVGRVGRHGQRLVEEPDRPLGRSEVRSRDRPPRRARAAPGWRSPRPRGRPARPARPRGSATASAPASSSSPSDSKKRAAARWRDAAVALGERAVGDLADERLDEARTGRARASAGRRSWTSSSRRDERRAAARSRAAGSPPGDGRRGRPA